MKVVCGWYILKIGCISSEFGMDTDNSHRKKFNAHIYNWSFLVPTLDYFIALVLFSFTDVFQNRSYPNCTALSL